MEEGVSTTTIDDISVHPEKPKKSFTMKEDASEFKSRARSFELPVDCEMEMYTESMNNSSTTSETAKFRRTEFFSKGRSCSEGCLSIKKPSYITSKYILAHQDPSAIKFSPKEFELPAYLTELIETEPESPDCELPDNMKKLSVSLPPEDKDKDDSDREEGTVPHPPSPRRFLSCIDIGPMSSVNADRNADTDADTDVQGCCSAANPEVKSEVRYTRNTNKMTTLMHVDPTLPLWMFFDVYGNVQKIKILGSVHPTQTRRLRPSSACVSNGSGLTVALPPRMSTAPSTPTQYHVSSSSNNSSNNNSLSSSSSSAAMSTLVLRSLSMPTSSFHLTTSQQTAANSSTAEGQSLLKVYSAPPLPAPNHNRGGQPNPHLSYPLTYDSGLGSTISSASEDNPIADNESNECNVCYERPINSVLYTCGHMCMCFECAMAVKQERGALCPICRQHIKDVIKIFRS